MCGGQSSPKEVFSDMYEFDVGRGRWRKLLGGDMLLPMGLSGHSSFYHSELEKLFVFGGHDNQNNFNNNVFICDIILASGNGNNPSSPTTTTTLLSTNPDLINLNTPSSAVEGRGCRIY